MHKIVEQDIEQIVNRVEPVACELSGKTVLLIGGMGFLGRKFCSIFDRLSENVLSSPCRVLSVDNMLTGTSDQDLDVNDNQLFFRHDIRKPLQLDERVDYIIHCAGVASPYYYRRFPIETIEVATLGTKNTLEIGQRDGARVLYFSSSEIYGDPPPTEVPTNEHYKGNVSCLGPRACYDESKRMGETMCHIYAEYFDTHTSIVRPFNIYGPGMRESDYRVLPNFASAIKAGKPLPIYAGGRQTRTYCYVVDAMVGFLLTLLKGRKGEPYNIGNPSPEISVNELADVLEAVGGKQIERKVLEYPESYPGEEPLRRCPDISKAMGEFNYCPEIDLHTGLKRFLLWTEDTYAGHQEI